MKEKEQALNEALEVAHIQDQLPKVEAFLSGWHKH